MSGDQSFRDRYGEKLMQPWKKKRSRIITHPLRSCTTTTPTPTNSHQVPYKCGCVGIKYAAAQTSTIPSGQSEQYVWSAGS